MKKRIGIFCAMVILIGIPFAAKAAEASGTDEAAVKSYGTIVYEDKNGSVRIYAEDIALLQEKLASVPEEIFDPVLYSHTHVWEYEDITEQSHTKHCAICGSKYDLTNAHSEASEKECIIAYGGHEYPGYENTCECGYTWKTENGHSLVCSPKDKNCHTQSCALAGTSYCEGMEKADVPHTIMVYPTDQTHHQTRCSECGYQGEIEECVFEFEEQTTMAGEEAKEVRKYCACGNYITESTVDLTNANMLEQEAEEVEEKPEVSDMEPQKSEITESVSGNDCMRSEPQDRTNKAGMIEREGENKQ